MLTSFAPHTARLEQHVRSLLRVLPIPMQASELATSLIEEAFAKVFSVIVDEAMAKSLLAKSGKRGPTVTVTAGFSPREFLKYYVLERGFSVTEKQLDSPQAKQIFERMTSDVDALAAALRTHLGN